MQLLDHLPAGVVVHDRRGRLLSANALACTLLARTAGELVGSESTASVWHFVREDDSDMPEQEYPVNRILHGAAGISNAVVGVRDTAPPGTRWLICNAYPESDGAGRLARVVVCFTDCSALVSAQRSLAKAEERLRLILRGSSDASWDHDLVTGETYYAERWFDMLGYGPGELPADSGLWMRCVHPGDRTRVARALRAVLAGTGQEFSIECRLRHRDGHDVPVLARGFVTRDGAGNAVRISGTNTDLTERRRSEQRLFEASHFDYLTGLPNRRYLGEELRRILARSHRGRHVNALLLVDIDHFSMLNDASGQDSGDTLLRQVALRLRGALRAGDQLARFGGDEFVAVLENLGPSRDAAVAETKRIIDKMLAALRLPYVVEGRALDVTASVGVTIFDAAASHPAALLRQAGIAAHQAKADGHDTVRFFDPAMQADVDKRADMQHALRTALTRAQFLLFCQPQFDEHGDLIGAETLVRWRRDGDMLLAPGEFIGLAESTGLIVPLGQYVLEESCRALARWSTDPKLAGLKLSVNVSVHQMREPGFPRTVAAILARTGARADRLWLELTESVFAADAADMILKMQDLRNQGLRFTLDDFGTGYSSLSYLRRFPLAGLKIDRSFVHDVHLDPDAVPIVEAIIALARSLMLEVVAEGVEHEEQRDFLVDSGCHAMQGYLFGRPVPIEEFERTHGTRSVFDGAER